jgi:hypothetical protein
MKVKSFSLFFYMFLFTGIYAQQLPKDQMWVNALDYGASGSKSETIVTTTSGSNQITVADPSDFRVGQGVMISKCDPHYLNKQLRGLSGMYQLEKTPFDDVVELRGFDGSGGDWLIFVLDIRSDNPYTFRWSDDLARSWHANVPITWDWQKLSGGMEIRFKKHDMTPGLVINFTARTQLRTTIEKIEGNRIWVKDAPTKSLNDAVMQHNDLDALKLALKTAQETNSNLAIPNGYYRIDGGLVVENTNIVIEGGNAENTILDISNGEGAVFGLRMGHDVTIRNFTILGHTGQADIPGTMTNIIGETGVPKGEIRFWCSSLKSCQAVVVRNTERVLVEKLRAVCLKSRPATAWRW